VGQMEPINPQQVREHIQKSLNTIPSSSYRPDLSIEVAFYGGSFTELPVATQIAYLREALAAEKDKRFGGIRISTRPDSLSPSLLKVLKEHKVIMVELGAQSMDDEVLRRINRGHTAQHTIKAVKLLRSFAFKFGLQLMIGLPGEKEKSLNLTAERVIVLSPDVVRLHPTLVIKDTPLAKLYYSGLYKPLGLQEAIDKSKRLVIQFEQEGIKVIRIGLQSSAALESPGTIVAGPYHPAFGHMVKSAIFFDLLAVALKKLKIDANQSIILKSSPSNISYLLGLKKENISSLQSIYGFRQIKVEGDKNLLQDKVMVKIGKNSAIALIKELSYRL